MARFSTKSALFEYFCDTSLKNYRHISSQHPQNCLFGKVLEKIKNA